MDSNLGDRLAPDLVTRYIRDLIVRGELARGQQLPTERELVSRLNVSRTTVRAGLQALASKGVLVIRQGAGTFVTDGPPILDSELLNYLAALHGFTRREMFEARRTLEAGVAGLAAVKATGTDLAAIADEVTGMFASLEDAQVFLVHDIRFHRAVAAASHNPILASIVEMVSGLFYELRRQTADRARDRRPAADAHRRIYQAIRDRDKEQAEAAMREHLLIAEREQQVEDPTDAPSHAEHPAPSR